jgi:hypothetical protein
LFANCLLDISFVYHVFRSIMFACVLNTHGHFLIIFP